MFIAVLQLYVIFLCNRCFPIKGHIHVSKRLCKSLQEGLPILHSKVLFCTVFFNNHYDPSLVAQMVKRLSTIRETWVQSLGWEDPLEKEMAIHFSTIAWKIPWTEEPGRIQSMGLQRVDMTERLHLLTMIFKIPLLQAYNTLKAIGGIKRS